MSRLSTLSTLAAAAVLAAGCATQPQVSSPQPQQVSHWNAIQYGRVQSIDALRTQAASTGGGAVVGGVVGGLIGNQMGKGGGRDAATVVGVVGGALIGDRIEKNRSGHREIYRVSVRLRHGGVRTFDYEQLDDLRVGDRVRIQNDQLMRY